MIRAAVIGHPIAQSLSPVIHNYWFRQYGIEGHYEAIDLAPEDLIAGIKKLVAQGCTGFNITVPHKQAVKEICDQVTEEALKIGAINTLVVHGGRIEGRNTDSYGFIENIRQEQSHFDFKLGPALVLGAGGAARAVVYGLLAAGVPEVFITNRTDEKAHILASGFSGATALPWADRMNPPVEPHLVVNTTTQGMKGQDDLDYDLGFLPTTVTVCDIVYKPLYTPLLREAQSLSLPVITGVGMLLHQARPAFAAWTGIMPEVTPALVEKILEKAQ